MASTVCHVLPPSSVRRTTPLHGWAPAGAACWHATWGTSRLAKPPAHPTRSSMKRRAVRWLAGMRRRSHVVPSSPVFASPRPVPVQPAMYPTRWFRRGIADNVRRVTSLGDALRVGLGHGGHTGDDGGAAYGGGVTARAG